MAKVLRHWTQLKDFSIYPMLFFDKKNSNNNSIEIRLTKESKIKLITHPFYDLSIGM